MSIFQSVQSLSHVRLFVTLWTSARQASLSITNSQSLLKLMSIELVMPFNHLILCHPLLLPPSIFPSIRVFSDESVLHIRWPRYWTLSISPLYLFYLHYHCVQLSVQPSLFSLSPWQETAGDSCSIPELGRLPEGGHDSPLQCYCWKNSVDRGA